MSVENRVTAFLRSLLTEPYSDEKESKSKTVTSRAWDVCSFDSEVISADITTAKYTIKEQIPHHRTSEFPEVHALRTRMSVQRGAKAAKRRLVQVYDYIGGLLAEESPSPVPLPLRLEDSTVTGAEIISSLPSEILASFNGSSAFAVHWLALTCRELQDYIRPLLVTSRAFAKKSAEAFIDESACGDVILPLVVNISEWIRELNRNTRMLFPTKAHPPADRFMLWFLQEIFLHVSIVIPAEVELVISTARKFIDQVHTEPKEHKENHIATLKIQFEKWRTEAHAACFGTDGLSSLLRCYADVVDDAAVFGAKAVSADETPSALSAIPRAPPLLPTLHAHLSIKDLLKELDFLWRLPVYARYSLAKELLDLCLERPDKCTPDEINARITFINELSKMSRVFPPSTNVGGESEEVKDTPEAPQEPTIKMALDPSLWLDAIRRNLAIEKPLSQNRLDILVAALRGLARSAVGPKGSPPPITLEHLAIKGAFTLEDLDDFLKSFNEIVAAIPAEQVLGAQRLAALCILPLVLQILHRINNANEPFGFPEHIGFLANMSPSDMGYNQRLINFLFDAFALVGLMAQSQRSNQAIASVATSVNRRYIRYIIYCIQDLYIRFWKDATFHAADPIKRLDSDVLRYYMAIDWCQSFNHNKLDYRDADKSLRWEKWRKSQPSVDVLMRLHGRMIKYLEKPHPSCILSIPEHAYYSFLFLLPVEAIESLATAMNKAVQKSPECAWIGLSSGEYITSVNYEYGSLVRALFVYTPLRDTTSRRSCMELAEVLAAVAVSSGDERVIKCYTTCLTALGDYHACSGSVYESAFSEKAKAIGRRNAAKLKPEHRFIVEVGSSQAHIRI